MTGRLSFERTRYKGHTERVQRRAWWADSVPRYHCPWFPQFLHDARYVTPQPSIVSFSLITDTVPHPVGSGPNTTTGHTSVIFSEESQIPHILKLLTPLRSGTLTSVVPTDAATDKYNDMLQARLENSVWTQCASWYRTGAKGRIFSTFPGPLLQLWWWLRKPRWDDFEVQGPGAEQWRRHHGSRARKVRAAKFTLVAAALGVLLAFAAYREGMAFSEFTDTAVRMWARFWDWLGIGTGTGLV